MLISKISKKVILLFIGILFFVVGRSQDTISINKYIELIKITDSVYVHVTYDYAEGYGWFSSNGMVVIKNNRAMIIDTPMDLDKTEALFGYLTDTMGVVITSLIAGHWHADCIGGIEYFHKRNLSTVCGELTSKICEEKGILAPITTFKDSLIIDHCGLKVVCKYFGAGHTRDNIVVWLPEVKILFGGCLIRAAKSNSLGNCSDAVVDEWGNTVEKVKSIPAETVIPGHGSYGGYDLLDHTIGLVDKVLLRKE